MLGVNETLIQARRWREKAGEDLDDTEKAREYLDKDMCARILAQWVTQSDENDAEKLICIIKGYEMDLEKEMTVRYQETAFGKPMFPDVQTQRKSTLSNGSTSENTQSQLPDRRSRFENQLQAYKLQVLMDDKLDKILSLMAEAHKN